MKINFDACRWGRDEHGLWLSLRVKHEHEQSALKLCAEVKDTLYTAELKRHRNRRSLDANAYMWVLIGKLAAVQRISPDEVYRQYIRDVGDNYFVVPIKIENIEHWQYVWCGGHHGRVCVDMGQGKISGYHNVMSYFGSSDYDTRQMSRLIDMVVADCKEQGIETMTEAELSLLKSEWANAEKN